MATTGMSPMGALGAGEVDGRYREVAASCALLPPLPTDCEFLKLDEAALLPGGQRLPGNKKPKRIVRK